MLNHILNMWLSTDLNNSPSIFLCQLNSYEEMANLIKTYKAYEMCINNLGWTIINYIQRINITTAGGVVQFGSVCLPWTKSWV